MFTGEGEQTQTAPAKSSQLPPEPSLLHETYYQFSVYSLFLWYTLRCASAARARAIEQRRGCSGRWRWGGGRIPHGQTLTLLWQYNVTIAPDAFLASLFNLPIGLHNIANKGDKPRPSFLFPLNTEGFFSCPFHLSSLRLIIYSRASFAPFCLRWLEMRRKRSPCSIAG